MSMEREKNEELLNEVSDTLMEIMPIITKQGDRIVALAAGLLVLALIVLGLAVLCLVAVSR